MAIRDELAERRITIAICDECRIRESHFYDSFGFDFSPVEWEHDWQRVRLGETEQAFCSSECLDKRLTAIRRRAYGEPAGMVS
jgi:hypothetical protein